MALPSLQNVNCRPGQKTSAFQGLAKDPVQKSLSRIPPTPLTFPASAQEGGGLAPWVFPLILALEQGLAWAGRSLWPVTAFHAWRPHLSCTQSGSRGENTKGPWETTLSKRIFGSRKAPLELKKHDASHFCSTLPSRSLSTLTASLGA